MRFPSEKYRVPSGLPHMPTGASIAAAVATLLETFCVAVLLPLPAMVLICVSSLRRRGSSEGKTVGLMLGDVVVAMKGGADGECDVMDATLGRKDGDMVGATLGC